MRASYRPVSRSPSGSFVYRTSSLAGREKAALIAIRRRRSSDSGPAEQALCGVQLADLPDPARQGEGEQDRRRYREEEEAEQVGQVVHALLAGRAGVRDLAAGSRAGVAQRVAQLAADHGHARYGVARRFEAVLDGGAGVVHAGAEDGQLVDRVVDLQRQPARARTAPAG